MPMNPVVKAKWVAALRSGEYKQGTQALKYETQEGDTFYCCLGVLCDLAVQDGVELDFGTVPEVYIDGVEVKMHIFNGDLSLPPTEVWAWAGLPSSNPRLVITLEDGREVEYQVAILNDEQGEVRFPKHTFAEIADLIEVQL